MKPLGWITVGFIGIVFVFMFFIRFFIEVTPWSILGTAALGIICIFLVVWSFLDYHK